MAANTVSSSNPRALQGVVLDCDGVLVDSEPIHDAVTRDELAARGIELFDSFFRQHVGMRVEDQMRVLAGEYGFDAAELYEAREDRFWSSLASREIPQVPGSVDAVRAVVAAGIPLGIATSGNRRWINHVMAYLGIADLVLASVSGDDVTRAKPMPEPYLTACSAIGVDPGLVGVVEDSAHGVRSASSAGCRVILLDRVGKFPAGVPGASMVVDNFADARDLMLAVSSEKL